MSLEEELRVNTINLYEIPVPFWQRVLGPCLHFHLGHFPKPDVSLQESMRLAMESLIMQIPLRHVERVLDVGCGWGGLAFELAKIWDAEVLGLTVSKEQARFVNEQARMRKLPVKAMVIDAETYDFRGIGKFDVLWLYESLEHIADRRSLFTNIQAAARDDVSLAITMHCRSPQISRNSLYNEFMGIQTLDSAQELIAILEDAGWEVLATRDCTDLTWPVWKFWAQNLEQITEPEFRQQAEKLTIALAQTEQLYKKGLLQSTQIVAKIVS